MNNNTMYNANNVLQELEKLIYKGKTVKMRFSSLCENENICNKCAGDLYYLLGIQNIGVGAAQLASDIKNIMMKSFHDSTDSYYTMDAMKVFGE